MQYPEPVREIGDQIAGLNHEEACELNLYLTLQLVREELTERNILDYFERT